MILPPPYFDHDDVPEGPIGPRDVGYRLRALDELLGEDLPRPRNEVETDLGLPSGDVPQTDPFEPSPSGGFSTDYLPWMTEGGRPEGATVSSREGESLFSTATGVWRGVRDAHEVVPQLLPGDELVNMHATTDADPEAGSHDEDQEVWSDWDEDEDDLDVYMCYPWRQNGEDDDDNDNDDEVMDGEGVFEGGDFVTPPPVSPDVESDDRGEEEEDTHEEDEEDVGAAPTSRNHRKARAPCAGPQETYTFPELTALTAAEISSWEKKKSTAFTLQYCLIGPDVVVKCAVPGKKGQPCNKQFCRKDIEIARTHFRATHFRKAQRKKGVLVACPWPGCKVRLKYRDTGRHLNIHWGIVYRCPRCLRLPDGPNRTDSLLRHMRKACRMGRVGAHAHPPTLVDGEATQQPEAGPSTQPKRSQRKQSQTRACAGKTQQPKAGPSTQRKTQQPRACPRRAGLQARTHMEQEQPQAGPSRGRKRARRSMEEEDWEKENIPEEDSEEDNDSDDDPTWTPTGADQKGKGKQRKSKKRKV